MDTLDQPKRAALDRQLEPGERVLWAAEASRGMQAGALAPGCVAVPLIAVGAVPLLKALSVVPVLFDERNGFLGFLVFLGFGLVFVGAGVAVLRQAAVQRRDLAATVWAVTDRRLLKVVARGRRTAVEAVPLRLVTGVDVYEYDDGSGSLTLTTGAPDNVPRRNGGPKAGQYRILGVKDAAAARRVIQEQVDRAVAAGPGGAAPGQ
jgi:hypothetical protein